MNIRTFTPAVLVKFADFQEQESKRTLLYVCLNPFVYTIGGLIRRLSVEHYWLFVIVMSVGSKDEYDYLCVMDFIDKAVLLGDTP